MEIRSSAFKHGVNEADIRHAIAYPLAVASAANDDDVRLVIGPSTTGALLELVIVLGATENDDRVIHAMAMRPKYRYLIEDS